MLHAGLVYYHTSECVEIKLIPQGLTFLAVFYVAVLGRSDEPNQQVLPGRFQVRHCDVTGGELHSAAFLDLINQSSRGRIKLDLPFPLSTANLFSKVFHFELRRHSKNHYGTCYDLRLEDWAAPNFKTIFCWSQDKFPADTEGKSEQNIWLLFSHQRKYSYFFNWASKISKKKKMQKKNLQGLSLCGFMSLQR